MTPKSPVQKSASEMFFRSELDRIGPSQPPRSWTQREAELYCRRWVKSEEENFTVLSWLVPRPYRQDWANIYAYCRWADHLADEVDGAEASLGLLDWWEQQLSLCYSGKPATPIMVALQRTIETHRIPFEWFQDLLTAFRTDQQQTRYDSDEQLLKYCTFSANPVGRILLRIGRADSDDNLRLSDQVCTGLQLANFCQDIARDAAIDRIYVPRERYLPYSITESQMLESHPRGEQTQASMRSMLRDWVAYTRGYFDRGAGLVHSVPRWLSPNIELFIQGGIAILDAIEKNQFDVWNTRPTLSKWKKIQILSRVAIRRFAPIRTSFNGDETN